MSASASDTGNSPAVGAIDPLEDKVELLVTKLHHLKAMLMMTWGEGGEAFRNYSGDTQDTYCWACSSLAEECCVILDDLRNGGQP